jgi:hypothetical protein
MPDNFLKNAGEELSKNHATSYTAFSSIEGIIIRGHILYEKELDLAIGLNIPKKEHYDPEKFTFSHKVRIARMLALIDKWLTEVNALNKLRNQIAHSLAYDDKLVDIIIKSTEKENDKAEVSNSTENRLKSSISFLCGHLAGYGASLGTYTKLRKHPDDLNQFFGKIDDALGDKK